MQINISYNDNPTFYRIHKTDKKVLLSMNFSLT